MAGEQGVGELGKDRVVVTDDAVDERLAGGEFGNDVDAISSLTVRDAQPDAFNSPIVAGRSLMLGP